ncbi:cilia- and flagella-associated protein 157-like isoform X2 [Homarus americanus]|uniref:cilia- and flagella-associated protein 157-like isoform X2 n=1 Tax=Homarus americanus TaxID=6706 RepID=UPI001C460F01|nr:cilia- and flagella-associated protein 157-like isoform X2 [Homarus americanus]
MKRKEKERKSLQSWINIIISIKYRLSNKSDEVEELRSRLSGLVKAKRAEQQEYEERLSTLAKEAENTRLDLNDKIIALTRKLESLEEFRQHKEELEAKLCNLEEELVKNNEKHQEKVSFLEKASLVEAAALRAELEARITRITEDLRRAAQTEVHSTTRRALHENEALTKQLDVFREKISAFRAENQQLRDSLSDSQVREGLLQDTVTSVTARGEQRARLLQTVTERAEQHSHIWVDYDRLVRENNQLRRDLQVMQGQLDASTQASCDLREKAAEKDAALEVTTSHLKQQDAARKMLHNTVKLSLSLLHHAAFMDDDEADGDHLAGTLEQLVSLLSSAESSQTISYTPPTTQSAAVTPDSPPHHAQEEVTENLGQVKYRAGDLGLLPRPHRKAKTQSAVTD